VRLIIDLLKRSGFTRLGRDCEARWIMLTARFWDLVYGIDTYMADSHPEFMDDEGYDPISYRGLHYLKKRIVVAPTDILMDIGCGRGRPNCVFARKSFILSAGIEYLSKHAVVASRNGARMRGKRTPIVITTGDAAEQSYDGVTLFFVFNPFGEETMRQVIARITRSVQAQPRSIRLVYINPKQEHILNEQPWLEQCATFTIPYRVGWPLSASIWQNTRR
jgi:hypothetical protein